MPASPNVPLGGNTTNRKWVLDVNTGTDLAPVWTRLQGMSDFKPSRAGDMKDGSTFDDGGFKRKSKTAEDWSIDLKVVRAVKTATPTAYDAAQEFLRLRSFGKMGVANQASVRYYEMEPGGPRVEAYAGRCSVDYTDDGGDMAALSTASIKLDGQGELVAITHPDAAA